MELQHLRYFIDVAEMENISKAAEKNHIAQPAMSRVISILEHEFGTRLFDRVGRNIKLNGCGQILMDASKEALNILDNVQEKINYYTGQLTGKVSVCMQAPVREIGILCESFKKMYPFIELNVYKPVFESGIQFCSDYDLFIYMGPMKFKDGYTSRVITSERLVAMVHETNPLAEKDSVYLSDLTQQEFILPQIPMLPEIVDACCYQEGFIPKRGGFANHPLGQMALLDTLPERRVVVAPENFTSIPDEKYKIISIKNKNCRLDISIAWNENAQERPSIEVFKKYLLDFFFPHPDN